MISSATAVLTMPLDPAAMPSASDAKEDGDSPSAESDWPGYERLAATAPA
jgi:hypothetical protein